MDEITRQIIEATHKRFEACGHTNIVDPPPGKSLRTCLDCGCRLIECDLCSNKTFARADIIDSGWTKGGTLTKDGVMSRWSYCPDCSSP